MKLHEYTAFDATGLAELVRKGDVSAAELASSAREAHDRLNPTVNAVVEFYEDAESVPGSNTGPLCGVPFLRKDIGPTEAGRLQEQGSRLFQGYRPTVDSYFFERARAGGLRTVGRTTLPEFGTGGMSESLACGITRNPWNLDRTTGGSSAGSAASVAAGIVPIAHGSDGGGSIRIPASYCGLVGLNPSRGRISGGPNDQDASYGLSRDFVLCRSVRDMAAALDVLRGAAPGDPFVIASPERPYAEELDRPTGRLRIGIATSPWGSAATEPEIRAAVGQTAAQLESMGHIVEEMPPPFDPADYRRMDAGLYHLGKLPLEAAARALGRQVDETTLEPVNLEHHRAGTQRPLTDAAGVFEDLRKFRADMGEATKNFDIILTPTMPCTAPPHTAKPDRAIFQYLGVFNVTGQPSVSLPLFHSEDGLPVGIQIVGRFGDEATLVRVARDLEEAIPWAARRPPVFAGSTLSMT